MCYLSSGAAHNSTITRLAQLVRESFALIDTYIRRFGVICAFQMCADLGLLSVTTIFSFLPTSLMPREDAPIAIFVGQVHRMQYKIFIILFKVCWSSVFLLRGSSRSLRYSSSHSNRVSIEERDLDETNCAHHTLCCIPVTHEKFHHANARYHSTQFRLNLNLIFFLF